MNERARPTQSVGITCGSIRRRSLAVWVLLGFGLLALVSCSGGTERPEAAGSALDDSDQSTTTIIHVNPDLTGQTIDPELIPERSGLGEVLASLYDQDPGDDVIACIDSRGADITVGFSADETAQQLTQLAAFVCDPNLTETLARAIPPSDEIMSEDTFVCAIQEVFKYVGTKPANEAIDALNLAQMPEEYRNGVEPALSSSCSMSSDQIAAFFAS